MTMDYGKSTAISMQKQNASKVSAPADPKTSGKASPSWKGGERNSIQCNFWNEINLSLTILIPNIQIQHIKLKIRKLSKHINVRNLLI